MVHRIKIFFLSYLLIWPSMAMAAGSSRLALVIGNADYDHAVFPALSNPIYDARDVAKTLEEFCFEVILEENADRESMLAAIEEFGRRLAEHGGLGLFYYSGHGLQYQQQQYLIPLYSTLFDEEELPRKAINADTIVQQMELAGNAQNILIFDTCREQFIQESPGLVRKDFIAMKGPANSVIVFSSSLGQSAFGDSNTRNSLYTRHLVQALQEDRGEDLLNILRAVNRRVTDEAVFYRFSSHSWQFLHKKGLPEDLLQQLQHPQLFQVDFAKQQFELALKELLSPEYYERYVSTILASAEQSQAPWLYTNITEEIVLSESCPSAPGNRPPLSVEILSVPETAEIALSAEAAPIDLMALLSVATEDTRYAWSLDADVGHLDGDTTSSSIRYIPPKQIEADTVDVNIVLTVRRGEEELRQEKRLTLFANLWPEDLPLEEKSVVPSSSSFVWKWVAGVGTVVGAVATAAIYNNSGGEDGGSLTNSSFGGTFEYSGSTDSGTISDSSDSVVEIEKDVQVRLGLVEWDDQIYGFRRKFITFGCCSAITEGSLSGTISGENTIELTWVPITLSCFCEEKTYNYQEQSGASSYRMSDNGSTLVGESGDDGGLEFLRVE